VVPGNIFHERRLHPCRLPTALNPVDSLFFYAHDLRQFDLGEAEGLADGGEFGGCHSHFARSDHTSPPHAFFAAPSASFTVE
jgi:hypothetical protein